MSFKDIFKKSFLEGFATAELTGRVILAALGMVGALSIVRFRTAIKDPLDLMFLFWSISVGIICGAGVAQIAVILSVAMTAGLLVLELRTAVGKALVRAVNAVEGVQSVSLMSHDGEVSF